MIDRQKWKRVIQYDFSVFLWCSPFYSLSPLSVPPAGPAHSNLHAESLCYTQSHRGGGGGSGGREGGGDLREEEDPTVPLLRQNVYAWYLAVSLYLASTVHCSEKKAS